MPNFGTLFTPEAAWVLVRYLCALAYCKGGALKGNRWSIIALLFAALSALAAACGSKAASSLADVAPLDPAHPTLLYFYTDG